LAVSLSQVGGSSSPAHLAFITEPAVAMSQLGPNGHQRGSDCPERPAPSPPGAVGRRDPRGAASARADVCVPAR
jgi:hypothetical protein